MCFGGGSTTYEQPAYPKELEPLLTQNILPWAMQNVTAQSPYYNTMQRMYEGILGSGSTVSPYMSNIISQGVGTGYMMPWYGSAATTPPQSMYSSTPTEGRATGGQQTYPADTTGTRSSVWSLPGGWYAEQGRVTGGQQASPAGTIGTKSSGWSPPGGWYGMPRREASGTGGDAGGDSSSDGDGGAGVGDSGPGDSGVGGDSNYPYINQPSIPPPPSYPPVNTYQYSQSPQALAGFLAGLQGQGGMGGMGGAQPGSFGPAGGPQLDPYAQQAMTEMSATGNPFAMTNYYQASMPVYQNMLDAALAQAKETSGMEGGLRGSAGSQALGKAASGTTSEYMQYLTNLAGQTHETAQARRLQAIPLAQQQNQYMRQEGINTWNQANANRLAYMPYAQQAEPLAQLQALMGAGQGVQAGQYPNLYPFLNAILGKQGSTAVQPGADNTGAMLGTAGSIAMAIAMAY